MMRSLWTAASGMLSQQQNVDTISNNLANVNTAGYKKERLEFKTLLYETMQRANLDEANQTGKPVNLQVGHGVRPIASSKMFTQGNLERTDHMMDFAIEGDGFFTVQKSADNIFYTKDGSFKTSVTPNGLMITTAEGYPVLGTDDQPIVLPANVSAADLNVAEDGSMSYNNAANATVALDSVFQIVQFTNPQGLEAKGANLLGRTPASGEPMREADGVVNRRSTLVQGVIEMSNVQIAEEMVKLIVAQRAYELNSKAITTSDDMLALANNLKR